MAETIRFEFIAQERVVFEDDVNMVIAPGAGGTLGVLPKHAPLMTVIEPGEIVVKKEGQPDRYFAVGGGFMEVRPNKITLLARSGEAADEIDIQRAGGKTCGVRMAFKIFGCDILATQCGEKGVASGIGVRCRAQGNRFAQAFVFAEEDVAVLSP